ncbi:hypothetical protein Anapl_05349 [Anas platyrhynchos]|uniref:Uncharacterized protein n=1 Tax=Anas platyrhynchos TaxID=8839 RepID=R0LRE0_ANAPL|nr:hypothetical protein Anapl_05349 [Anas platyrhynchos]
MVLGAQVQHPLGVIPACCCHIMAKPSIAVLKPRTTPVTSMLQESKAATDPMPRTGLKPGVCAGQKQPKVLLDPHSGSSRLWPSSP